MPVTRPCGQCLAQPPAIDRSIIPYVYAAPLDRLITGLKFHQRLSHARLLAELLLPHIPDDIVQSLELLLPVPLHPQRLRQRGFNQALEICRFLATHLAIPMDSRTCRRIKPTLAQTSLDVAARRRNVRQAFEMQTSPTVQHVAIVDDVVTTGQTVNALARCLKQAGITQVSVIAVARAELKC